MIIDGERGEYYVTMEQYGWSSVCPHIHVRETRPVLRWFRQWRCVAAWPQMTCSRIAFESWYPWDVKSWFQRAVRQYEAHLAAWEAHGN